ncbi:hypothetical protein [Candidatus Tisiphia endosymbiont of Hybos culiciformis]|uniref:hypothetical protein n=1 Tax=Candidatus Tisiphia endosymbiont of Hybos culiciformis TaxID=3139331 RepID=UPI003CCAE2D6
MIEIPNCRNKWLSSRATKWRGDPNKQLAVLFLPLQFLDCRVAALWLLAMTTTHLNKTGFLLLVVTFKLPWLVATKNYDCFYNISILVWNKRYDTINLIGLICLPLSLNILLLL